LPEISNLARAGARRTGIKLTPSGAGDILAALCGGAICTDDFRGYKKGRVKAVMPDVSAINSQDLNQ
jgi:hypothetical protein